MTLADVVPVHRCATYGGRADGAALTTALCRSAVAARSPVIAYVDDAIRHAVAAALGPSGRVAFRAQQLLVGAHIPTLVGGWLDALHDRAGQLVTVICQQPLELQPDVERWRAAEDAVTREIATRPVALTCLFDTTTATLDDLHMARTTHPAVWAGGVTLPNPDHLPCDLDEVFPTSHPGTLAASAELVSPRASVENRRRWRDVLAGWGVDEERCEHLVLVLQEAVTAAAAVDPSRLSAEYGVRLRLFWDGRTVTAELLLDAEVERLVSHRWPQDRRLSMLWLAAEASHGIRLAVRPGPSGSRLLLRADPLD